MWSQTFVYDRYGNRVMLASSTPAPAPATGVPRVTADDPAQVTALLATYTDPVSGSTVVKNQWLGSTVDAVGNVQAFTSSTYPTNLTYDAENRLVSAQTGEAGTMAAEYDGEGRRVKRTVNGVETVYVHDAMGRLVQEYGGGPDTATGRQYLVADHLGSTRMTLNENGVVQTRSDYFPFGQEIEPGVGGRTTAQGYLSKVVADADRQRMRFTGQLRDGETGLDFFLARYYGGAQGRFTSPDEPLIFADQGNPQTWSLYAYALNNPLLYSDPTGHDPCTPNGILSPGKFCVDGVSAQAKQPLSSASAFNDWMIRATMSTFVISTSAAQKTMELAQPAVDWLSRPRDSGCLSANTAGWAAAGANIGMVGALVGGAGELVTSPTGFAIGGVAGWVFGMNTCRSGSSGSSGDARGGAEHTEDFELFNDATGKVHGNLPKHVPAGLTRGQLERAAAAPRKSIVVRQQGFAQMGRAGNHGVRLAEEQALLRQILKRLGQ